MAKRTGWPHWAGIFNNENSKGPWGGGSGSNGDGDGGSRGPRNPWAFPPEGRRTRPSGTASTLDEFLKRSRRGGGGGGGSGGLPGIPGGRSLWLLIAGGLVLAWILFTSIHPISPEQRGVVTYLGRYTGTLGPGIQFTAPAPFASVRTVNVQEIRDEDFPQGTEPNLMITGDQNIVDLAYQVRWDVADPQDFVFQIRDPEETVRATAESAMRAVVATATLDETIGAGRTEIEARVREMMQQILDEYNSGVRVQGVAIKNATPPAAVDEDFKQVTAAQQQAQANLNNARAYAQQIIAQAQGEAAQFDKIYEQYRLAPEVTRRRLYYETMERVLERSDTTVIEAEGVTPYLPLPEIQRRTQQQAQQPQTNGEAQ
ncbi:MULTISPECIES: protease modulator HflK [unclassified Sphingosinithalassobacter]|uniref:protease modulator HflK n=1 Tax=unclassified Sphingosinithalassobacter TaxID=2676235 RepID=UPI00165DAFE4|nr:protease modulator HflK [Sphingosinithalassobacter sp. CS137]